MAAIVSSERSFGWLVANRIRRTPVAATACEQLGEAGLAVEVAPVGVHVLAEQRDLDHAVGHETLDLGHDVVERAAALRGRGRTGRCSTRSGCRSPP